MKMEMSKMFKKNLLTLSAYENQAGWKRDEDGNVQLIEGNPVFVAANGKEYNISGDTIPNLNAEAKSLRLKAEKAIQDLGRYEGLDPDQARDALSKLSKINSEQLIDSGKLDEVRSAIAKEYETKVSATETKYNELKSKFESTMIDNIFSNSDFVRNNIAVPHDMFKAAFKEHLKFDNGEVVAVNKDGSRIYSKKEPGSYASPEEALKILAEMHPNADAILKADVGSGSGNSGAGGNGGGVAKISRSEFEKLPALKKTEVMTKVSKGEITLVA